MKKIVFVLAILISGTVMAQEEPTEIKEESKVKTIKYKDGKETKEKKLKVVTRETANVELDKRDAHKVNQKRIDATKKVEKVIMIDDDSDEAFDVLTKTTYFVKGDDNYKFIPNNNGFDIAFDNDNNRFVKVGKAWSSQAKGNYIVRGKMHNGIGYFDTAGNFVIEYYDEKSQSIKTKVYKKRNPDL
ncbi:hypothetical protein KFZ70_13370 [Tamlana fucoidanivorans]|uniref:Uncharacterized protein n=1 Tax=Allotamlana fucoidanivorans TaxID=2583814 RepID=A0A5C4SRE7_9FLAO|nr:hypothetical protein [Tamlana fucoidanivorans]TNJ46419.1 hypothetical protein FGF67_01995 [Tamlana fucoidanivorans]